MDAKRSLLKGTVALGLMLAWPASGAAIDILASAGRITAPFVLTNNYIVQDVQTGVTNGGRAAFDFAVTSSGDYVVFGVFDAPADHTNAFYVNIDGEPQDAMDWDITVKSAFATNSLCTTGGDRSKIRTFRLASGSHELIVRGREANAKLLKLSLVKYDPPVRPAGPTHLRVVTGP
jgi:hypothetical protein